MVSRWFAGWTAPRDDLEQGVGVAFPTLEPDSQTHDRAEDGGGSMVRTGAGLRSSGGLGRCEQPKQS